MAYNSAQQEIINSFVPGQKNSAAVAAQKAEPKAPAKIMPPNNGPTGFWQRIGEVGVGEVNLLNAAKAAKSVVTSTKQSLEQGATGIARDLPGGTNDLQAELQQSQQASKQTAQAQLLKKQGKISSPQAAKLTSTAANNSSQAQKQTTSTVKTMPTKKEVAGGLATGALLAVPGVGEVKSGEVTGAALLKQFGTQGVKDLAEKAGVNIEGKGSIEAANLVGKTKPAIQAFKKATLPTGERAAKTGLKTGTQFGAFNAAGTASQGGSNKEIIKSGAEGFVEGAAVGAAGSLASKAIKSKMGKVAPTVEKATAERELVTTPTKNLGNKGIAEAKFQEASAPPKTKLLPAPSGKVEGKGFTASSVPDAQKVQLSARLSKINSQLESVAQGKTSMSTEDIRSLKAEKANITKVANGSAKPEDFQGTPGEIKTTSLPSSKPSAKTPIPVSESKLPGQGSGTKSEQPKVTVDKVTGKKVSGSALRTESQAVESGMKADFEDETTYKPGSYKDEADKAAKLVHENPEKAKDIALGRKPANNPMHESAVYHAVKNKALAENDTETIRQLVSAPRHAKISKAAQKLGAEGFNSGESDPIKLMRQIVDARSEATTSKLGKAADSVVNDTVKEIASKEKPISHDSWKMFVESIKC